MLDSQPDNRSVHRDSRNFKMREGQTNRSVVEGSGIFILPATVLKGTDSIGITLIIWAFAGVVSVAALLVWLELSLSIPRYELDGTEVSVPRSGGEKNYVSALFRRQVIPGLTGLVGIYLRESEIINDMCIWGVVHHSRESLRECHWIRFLYHGSCSHP